MVLDAADIKEIFNGLQATMEENRDHLIEIDAALGDGDLGLTMDKGFRAASDQIALSEEGDTGILFMKAGMAMANSAPSTMGTLVGSGFMAAGKALSGKSEVNESDLAKALVQLTEGIMQRGKSKPGEKTIVDSLYPAVHAFQEAAEEGKPMPLAMEKAFQACEKGLEETKKMIPRHGKQVAHRQKSEGKIDPGAKVGFLIIRVFYSYILNKFKK